jgi:hypothetical protein
MPRSLQHQQNLARIQAAVAETNPYRRDQQNRRSEFYIYNQGFLASYLASLAEQDPWILKRFLDHCDEVRRPK